MVDAATRERVKSKVGNYYVKKVMDLLNDRGVVSRDGEPYKRPMISMVMNGSRENLAIEDAIRTIDNETAELSKT